jgi:ArsR family transcriptional regulator, arsenate/arsenite/antimonite-responsive transcriptional repressor
MRAFMAITKALSDQNRVSIVLALEGREVCVCQIIQFLGLAPSTVSKHLSILKQARLIEDRKDGRWMYYRLADEDAPTEVREAIAWVCRSLADSQRIQKDAQRLQSILAIDPKELCKQQNRTIAVI